jgi:hypothetical protein
MAARVGMRILCVEADMGIPLFHERRDNGQRKGEEWARC